MTRDRQPLGGMTCAEVDELDAAYALGALDGDERTAIEAHLAECPAPHAELRSLLGADAVLSAALEPVAPSAALRDRLMRTVAETPQERDASRETFAPEQPAARPVPSISAPQRERSGASWLDWLTPARSRGLLAVAVAVAIVLGGWSAYLQTQLSSRDQALRAVATAIAQGAAAFPISGSGGTGYVVADRSGKASMIVADLPAAGSGRLYELWLIGADNKPVAVGTYEGSSAPVAVVTLERSIAGYTTFAVTIETHRVDAPTSQPVMTATIGG